MLLVYEDDDVDSILGFNDPNFDGCVFSCGLLVLASLLDRILGDLDEVTLKN